MQLTFRSQKWLKKGKKTKQKIDAAHFLDARGNEKQVSNLEWP